MIRASWSGEDWQEYCRDLLSIKFGDDIQFIPDRDGGDGGLEAYRLDDNVVYQCYAAQDAYDVAALTDAQKAKIRKDLAKLVNDTKKTADILGADYLIRRWVLLTPNFDSKELVMYARGKSARVRASGAPWCHSDFQILIQTDENFPAERGILGAARSPALYIEPPTDSAGEAPPAPEFQQRIDDKLKVDPDLAASDEARVEYMNELLLDYSRGALQLGKLKADYASTYDQVARASSTEYRGINRTVAGSSSPGPRMVSEITDKLIQSIGHAAPALDASMATDLARFYVADWFVQCPLRFRH